MGDTNITLHAITKRAIAAEIVVDCRRTNMYERISFLIY